MVLSDAVVIVRTKGLPWSRWNKHTRWLERTKEQRRSKENKKAKRVEPDDHSEVTRGHELHPHELASISSMMVVP
jgi:hypothetical protein